MTRVSWNVAPTAWPATSPGEGSSTATSSRWRCPTRSTGSSPMLPAGSSAPSPAGVGRLPPPRAGRHRRPRRAKVVVGAEPGGAGGADPAGRLCTTRRTTSTTARCPTPTSPGVEGADLGRLDRPAQAHRLRRSRRARPRRAAAAAAMDSDGCLVMPGPLYHNGPAVWSCQALLAGNHVVVLPRFDAEATLAAIEEHRADIVYLVPTMMKRIWRLPRRSASATTCPRCASCGTSPSRARCGSRRRGSTGSAREDLRALRRHRGAGGTDHHRPEWLEHRARSAGRAPASS